MLPAYMANRVIRKRTRYADSEGEWVQSLPDRIRPIRDIQSLASRDRITFDVKPIAILSNPISDPPKSILIDIGWGLNAGLWPAFL